MRTRGTNPQHCASLAGLDNSGDGGRRTPASAILVQRSNPHHPWKYRFLIPPWLRHDVLSWALVLRDAQRPAPSVRGLDGLSDAGDARWTRWLVGRRYRKEYDRRRRRLVDGVGWLGGVANFLWEVVIALSRDESTSTRWIGCCRGGVGSSSLAGWAGLLDRSSAPVDFCRRHHGAVARLHPRPLSCRDRLPATTGGRLY